VLSVSSDKTGNVSSDKSGDADAAYSAFVAAAWGRHLRLARLLTGDPHRAEEMLQDCLVRLYVHWRRLSARGDPTAYLRRMLVNGNVSRWRRGRREELTANVSDHVEPATWPPEPPADLSRALLRLPRQQRAVVVLRWYADLSERVVAATLGCSVGTVKSQNARALARLRELLPVPEESTEGVPPR